jgi:hypothetical protein
LARAVRVSGCSSLPRVSLIGTLPDLGRSLGGTVDETQCLP